jgi:lipopolysaccharide/colanic/teichoic acid biosynthesis glycosyltransferase/glycosyltransferase involved in cell wall biosynthesis
MISVIIPAKDAAATIAACLDGALTQRDINEDYEVILVDDGSGDNTAEIGKSKGVKVIRQENAGPAAARNAGADIARGEILAFTDADCVPSPTWLARLIEPFQDPNVVGAKGTYRTDQCGLVPRFVQQEYGYKYVQMAKQDSIDFIDTYSAAYRRAVFLENGGFDSAFAVPSVEDQELSFRLARKGYRMVFVPDAVVRHQHDRHVWEYARRKGGIGYWKAFMLRWLPEKTFQDSHTPGTLRWQIFFLAVLLLISPVAMFWTPGWLLVLLALLGFYGFGLPLMSHIARRDRAVLPVAPLLLLVRAGALGSGLAWGLAFPPRRQPRVYTGLAPMERFLKRTLDIVGASVGLILSAPLLLLAAIAIKLDSRGPIFFTQERVGENGKPFRVFKLRTMVDGAQDQVQKVLRDNPLAGPVYKIPNDPRITPVGKVLRRWSLDEIPQFWNVLRGEMSLVGPRPEETWVVDQYTDEQRQRLAVKPGLTGPMQVSGRGELDMDARLALEIDYINDYSLWEDVSIIIRTIPAVLSGKGAF